MMKNPRDTYLAASVTTASPARLLVMLYERLSLDLNLAARALAAGDPAAAHGPLLHAQDIVLELNASLKPDVWSGAVGLAALYDYLHRELVAANVNKDPVATGFCLKLVDELRDAWREAAGLLLTASA